MLIKSNTSRYIFTHGLKHSLPDNTSLCIFIHDLNHHLPDIIVTYERYIQLTGFTANSGRDVRNSIFALQKAAEEVSEGGLKVRAIPSNPLHRQCCFI